MMEMMSSEAASSTVNDLSTMASRNTIALFAGLILLAACAKEEEPAPVDLGMDYFPARIGAWVEYQVDSLWRDDPAGVLDSVSYRLREQVSEQYQDPSGRTAYRLLRSVLNTEGEWVVRDVWTFTVNNTAAEMTEENKRRIKLTFPVREGRTWDINATNSDQELLVAHREVGSAWATDSLSWAATVLVRNTQPPNPVITRNFEERYAKGVGLVRKYWEETNTQTTGVVGFRMNMVAVAYGQE